MDRKPRGRRNNNNDPVKKAIEYMLETGTDRNMPPNPRKNQDTNEDKEIISGGQSLDTIIETGDTSPGNDDDKDNQPLD